MLQHYDRVGKHATLSVPVVLLQHQVLFQTLDDESELALYCKPTLTVKNTIRVSHNILPVISATRNADMVSDQMSLSM